MVLTGYGAIATAVAAVKIGATDYLSKPADANDITNALLAKGEALPPPPENPMSADRVRWEHIQRVYELCDRNVQRNRAAAEHAPPDVAAHSGQAQPALRPAGGFAAPVRRAGRFRSIKSGNSNSVLTCIPA